MTKKHPEPAERYYTVPELALAWGVCERTIRRRIAAGELEAVRIGRAVRITPAGRARYLGRPRGH